MKKAIRDLSQKQARIGFFEYSKYEDGTPAAYVATIQEFGYPGGNIPPRPFFRPTIAEQRNAWRMTLAKGAKAVMNGRLTVQMMLEQFGLMAAGDVKKTIAAVNAPALSELTLELRALKKQGVKIGKKVISIAAQDLALDGLSIAAQQVSRKPLVDTGFMLSQVNSDVVDK